MKTPIILTAAAAAAAIVAAAAPASAQQWRWNEAGWRTIGYTTVDGRDSDTVYAPGVSRQREVRICALNAPLRVNDVDIRFANGGRQDVQTRAALPAGRCTRAIDLKGNRRDIVNVRLRYEPLRRGVARPVVRIQVR